MSAHQKPGLSLIFVLFLFLPSFGNELLFFYERGCPDCARIQDFLDKRIKPHYSIIVKTYEIHDPENSRMLLSLAKAFNSKEILKKGTPAVFIGNKAFQGSSRVIQRKIEEAVRTALREKQGSPFDQLPAKEHTKDFAKSLTLPALIGAAAVDAVNPCACAVLVLLLGTILLASRKKRRAVLGAGFSFTAACFVSYYLMGLGLFAAIQVSGLQHYVYITVAFLAVFIGSWNIKTSLWKERGRNIGVPRSWQPRVKRITSGITSIPGAFFMGFLISLFLLPCTSGPYIVIIGMLSRSATRIQAIWLLLLYNTIFVLPFVLITIFIGFGFTTTARVEMWRQKKQQRLHLFTGIIMLALGVMLGMLLLTGTV